MVTDTDQGPVPFDPEAWDLPDDEAAARHGTSLLVVYAVKEAMRKYGFALKNPPHDQHAQVWRTTALGG